MVETDYPRHHEKLSQYMESSGGLPHQSVKSRHLNSYHLAARLR
jgi:hypothetical protein